MLTYNPKVFKIPDQLTMNIQFFQNVYSGYEKRILLSFARESFRIKHFDMTF